MDIARGGETVAEYLTVPPQLLKSFRLDSIGNRLGREKVVFPHRALSLLLLSAFKCRPKEYVNGMSNLCKKQGLRDADKTKTKYKQVQVKTEP